MHASGSDPRGLDLRALTAPVSVREVTAFERGGTVPPGRRWHTIATVVAVYLVVQAAFVTALVPAAGLGRDVERIVVSGFLVVTGLYAALMMSIIWRNAVHRVRMTRAAEANGMRFDDRAGPGMLRGGTVVTHSSFTFASEVLRGGSGGHPFVAATVGPRPGTSLRRPGLIVIPLPRETPHIVLENRRAGVLRTTGRRFRADQRLRLEGDFDRTFSLYCPRGYETDALYIFTPDLMALMLDVAGRCEAELVAGDLVLYTRGPLRLWRPERFAGVVALSAAVGSKARSQTSRYEDIRRDASHAIGAAGRRLRARPTVGALLSVAVPAALIGYGLVSLVLP